MTSLEYSRATCCTVWTPRLKLWEECSDVKVTVCCYRLENIGNAIDLQFWDLFDIISLFIVAR